MIIISPEVQQALDANLPIVALESTIISHGMPWPQNAITAKLVEDEVRKNGAVPATIAIRDGKCLVGLREEDIDYLGQTPGVWKVSLRDMPYVIAKKLPGAKETEVEKIEGPNKIKIPAITTTAPLTQFKSDELTIIVRPKKDEAGAIIPNEYIVLSAFPGDPSIPRASEWGKKYAVIIPNVK